MPLRLGLLGRNISYSLSPRIFEWAFEATGVEGQYVIHDLGEADVRLLIQSGEWDGLNVTIPYKVEALRFCDVLTASAQDAAAVNTLFRKDGAVWGEDTDIAGCGYALARRREPEDHWRKALVIGSGGAARAVLVVLRRDYAGLAVTVASRHPSSARQNLNESIVSTDIDFCSLADAAKSLGEFDLVVNATPKGTHSYPGTPLPSLLRFKPSALVMDLIYDPQKTEFLRQAEVCGARIENGLVMLIAQAAASFQIWTGHKFPLSQALEELLPRLETHDPLPHRR